MSWQSPGAPNIDVVHPVDATHCITTILRTIYNDHIITIHIFVYIYIYILYIYIHNITAIFATTIYVQSDIVV